MLLLHAAGFKYVEIARITGDSVRTVERQLRRAREKRDQSCD
jgi:DNA-directed RNA polymerase specialized sigma24 family protein